MVLNQTLPEKSNEENTIDIIQDFNMIIAGIHQTFGNIDIMNTRARDIINIYLPNMHKDTAIMSIARIRSTPMSKLSKEEKKLKHKYKLKNRNLKDSSCLLNLLNSIGGAKSAKK